MKMTTGKTIYTITLKGVSSIGSGSPEGNRSGI
jgi:hypothetical protein